MDQIGVGIIGCGGISQAHAESFQRLNRNLPIKMIAFADVNLKKAQQRKSQFGAIVAVEDYRKMIESEDIQIVSIASPPWHHFQTIKDCLLAGKHVLCEKPVVLNLAQLDEIEKIAVESNCTFGGAFQWRFGNGVRQAKALYDHGFFGKVVYASNNLFWHRTEEYFRVEWRNCWEKSGGGIMFTLACHGLDALIYILGDVDHVSAELDAIHFNIEIDDSGAVILRFKNGALGHIAATVNAQKQRSRLEIIGTRLEAISSEDPYGVAFKPWQFRSVDKKHQQQVNEFLKQNQRPKPKDYHDLLVADFVDAVLKIRQPLANTQEIRRSLQVLTAIYKANRLAARVNLPILGDDPFYHNMNPNSPETV